MKRATLLKGLTALLMLPCLLTGATSDSRANTWTLDVATTGNGGTTPWTNIATGGIATNGPAFKSFLLSAEGGNPLTYNSPSNVIYGEIFTDLGTGNGTGTFPIGQPASFNFTVYKGAGTGGPSQNFSVRGVFEGATLGSQGSLTLVQSVPTVVSSSQARFRVTNFTTTTGSIIAGVSSFDPVMSAPSLRITTGANQSEGSVSVSWRSKNASRLAVRRVDLP